MYFMFCFTFNSDCMCIKILMVINLCVWGENSSNKFFLGTYVSMIILLHAHWRGGTNTFDILLHTKAIPKLIGDGFCTPIIFKSPIKTKFSIRNKLF